LPEINEENRSIYNEERNIYGWIILLVAIVLGFLVLLIEFGATGDSVFMGDIGMVLVALLPMLTVVIVAGLAMRLLRKSG